MKREEKERREREGRERERKEKRKKKRDRPKVKQSFYHRDTMPGCSTRNGYKVKVRCCIRSYCSNLLVMF